MAEASLAAQRQAVVSMRAHAPLAALVPVGNIFDRSGRPEVFPCIIVGDAQVIGDDIECADLSEVILTIDAWTKENGMVAVKDIAGAIRRALRDVSAIQDGFALDFRFDDARYLRDPSGEHSHAILTFSVTAEDTVAIT